MRRYLVIQLARLGDLLQSKRLILTLCALGETHLVVDSELAPLAGQIYPQTVIHAVTAHYRAGKAKADLRGSLAAFTALASVDFEAVYNLNRHPLNLAPAGLFEPERVLGQRLENGQAVSSTWNKMALRWTRDRRRSPLNLMDFWAFFHPSPLDAAKVNPEAKAQNSPGSVPGQRIGVVLAGREARRSLPPSILAPIMEALFARRKGPEFILLGGRGEAEQARRLLRELPRNARDRSTDLSGRTQLTDLPDILRGLDLLLTPDTGLMHLAAHLGTPVMAFFLSSAWAWETGPYGLGHLIRQALAPCSPCLESAPCPHALACLQDFKKGADLTLFDLEQSLPQAEERPLLLRSGFDSLGAVLHGADPSRQERLARRSLLAAFLGLDRPQAEDKAALERACAALMAESDWMLPDYGFPARGEAPL